jgi:hypothetical protein
MNTMAFDPIFFLRQNFSGLKLDGRLFYGWPLGIRFDLGGRAVTPEETAAVLRRATKLFEAVFDAWSPCVVVAQDWPGDDNPPAGLTHLTPLFKLAQRHSIGIGGHDGSVELREPKPANGRSILTWASLPSRSFAYELVFEGIANADHAREPSIGSRVYFINASARVIVTMYDDRGMDVIATDRETLRGLYREFNEWILDYDRTAIDRTFDTK